MDPRAGGGGCNPKSLADLTAVHVFIKAKKHGGAFLRAEAAKRP
jgi:hypothetical protein